MALTQAELDAAQGQINAARDQAHTNIDLARGWAEIAEAAADASGSSSAQVATAEANRAGQQRVLAETARSGAETARSGAETAQGLAETARDNIDTLIAGKIDKAPANTPASQYLNGSGAYSTPPNTTYSVPTQAEAEAGTANTARAFSAQRVRQAADAAITARIQLVTEYPASPTPGVLYLKAE